MSSISPPFQAQFDMSKQLASTFVDSADRLISLNLALGRSTAIASNDAWHQLLQASDAAEAMSVSASHSQPLLECLFAYGRELFDITAAAQAGVLRSVIVLKEGAP